MLNFRLEKYWVEDINYKLNIDTYSSCLGKTINIDPQLKRDIVEIDDNKAIVKLSIKVDSEKESPFGMLITICGEFVCKAWKDTPEGQDFMKFTSVQVLFPYLRQIVSTVTSLSNIQPYVLPVINVFELFK